MKKGFNVFLTIITSIIGVFAIIMITLSLFGFKSKIVLSGSMEPNIHTGSIVYVKEVETTSLKETDVITFNLNGKTCTHRIVSIDYDNKTIITKGDANISNDEPISFNNVEGKVMFTIPLLGYVLFYLKKYLVLIVGGIIVLVLVYFIIKAVKEK